MYCGECVQCVTWVPRVHRVQCVTWVPCLPSLHVTQDLPTYFLSWSTFLWPSTRLRSAWHACSAWSACNALHACIACRVRRRRRPGTLTGGLANDAACGSPVAREMRAARDMREVPDMPTFYGAMRCLRPMRIHLGEWSVCNACIACTCVSRVTCPGSVRVQPLRTDFGGGAWHACGAICAPILLNDVVWGPCRPPPFHFPGVNCGQCVTCVQCAKRSPFVQMSSRWCDRFRVVPSALPSAWCVAPISGNFIMKDLNHRPHGCLLNRLFRRRSKKTCKLRVIGLCAGNSPVTGEFPAQRASNAENASILWRHHATYGSTRSQPIGEAIV